MRDANCICKHSCNEGTLTVPMIHVAHHSHDSLYVFVTWVFDGLSKLTKDGAAKHGAQEDVEHTPEEEELADAAVHL